MKSDLELKRPKSSLGMCRRFSVPTNCYYYYSFWFIFNNVNNLIRDKTVLKLYVAHLKLIINWLDVLMPALFLPTIYFMCGMCAVCVTILIRKINEWHINWWEKTTEYSHRWHDAFELPHIFPAISEVESSEGNNSFSFVLLPSMVSDLS